VTRILLVDSKKDVRDFVSRLFTERNFEVVSAANGVDALASLKRLKPDIVLMDLILDDMDGIDVLRRLKKFRRRTKVIVISSTNDVDKMREAKKCGIIRFFVKPIQLHELLEAVVKNAGRQRRYFNMNRKVLC